MKERDLVNLLNRAAAAIETPNDLNDQERDELVEDLTVAANEMIKMVEGIDEFTDAYITAMLWSESDINSDSDKSLNTKVGVYDFALETLERVLVDCKAFQERAGDTITDDVSQAGHDFWLTRNKYGVGFLDGDWPEHGEALSNICNDFPEITPYIGDDGKVYFFEGR